MTQPMCDNEELSQEDYEAYISDMNSLYKDDYENWISDMEREIEDN